MIPPYLIWVRVRPQDGKGFWIWLPLFILWPLGLAIAILAFGVAIVVDTILLFTGRRYHHYTLLLWRLHEVICASTGTTVRVTGANTVDVIIR